MSSGNQESLPQEAARRLIHVVPAVQGVLRTVLGLRFPEVAGVPQVRVLFRLSVQARFSLKELAELERVSPPTMSRSIETLLAKGWVSRTASDEDRRAVWISLTESGRGLVERIMADLNLQFATLLGSWDDRSLSVLIQGLTLLENSSFLEAASSLSLGPWEADPKAPR